MWTATILLTLLPAADKNEAEQLVRQMETKLTSAKTLECTFEVVEEYSKHPADKKRSSKGYLAAAEGNKIRFEMTGNLFNDQKLTMVSDGAELAMILSSGKSGGRPTDAPKWLGLATRRALARMDGYEAFRLLTGGFELRERFKDFQVDDHCRVYDIKLGKKEKVGDREAQVIHYNFALDVVGGNKGVAPWSVSLWLDAKTHLPLEARSRLRPGW